MLFVKLNLLLMKTKAETKSSDLMGILKDTSVCSH